VLSGCNPRIGVAMSHRKEKINSLLEQEVGKIILREIDIPPGVLVTVISADATEDLKEAKIMISVLPFDKSQKILEILNKNIYFIQQILNKELRMKPVPKISFKIDDSMEKAGRVENLLKSD
jgi:ribosome-binding factor A